MYLGHRVSSDGIINNPDKIVAVRGGLVPNTVKQHVLSWDLLRITENMARVSSILPDHCMIV